MKNRFLFLTMLLSLFIISSCDKDIETSPLMVDSSNSKRTEVSVYLDGDFDLSTVGMEAIPDGQRVVFTVSNDDLVDNAEGNQVLAVSTSGGYAIVNLPVNSQGVATPFTIEVEDFIYDQIQGDGSTSSKKFSYNLAAAYTASFGVNKKIESTATFTTVIDEFETANINGKLHYDDTLGGGYVNLVKTYASGQKMIVSCNNPVFEKEITLNANGEFSIDVDVPKGGTASYSVKLVPFTKDLTERYWKASAGEYWFRTSTYKSNPLTLNFNGLSGGEIRFDNNSNSRQISMTKIGWND